MDIASSTLDGNADAVEFCPHPTFHELLATATYTLQQDGVEPIRSGSISLFSATTSGLKLLHRIHTSGVFDIKWNPRTCEANGFGNTIIDCPLLAQVSADGFLTLYSLHSTELSLSEFCKEELSSSSMCLCVDWSSGSSSISVGLSDGWISTIALREDRLQVLQTWAAHEYETWAVSFDACQFNQLLYTGSDDCCFTCWDLRQSSTSTVFRNAKSHKMGVCCITQCPSDSNMLLTGSYDEFVRVWDVRYISRPVVESSLCLGGGVWRLKHHPWISGLVLAACMHSGFAIVKIDGDNINLLETYTKHESLAYGADWQRADESVEHGKGSSFVATCSFYDSLLRIWKPHSFEVTFDDGKIPPITCIVSDGAMSFTLEVSSELGIPNVFFWTSSASGYLAFQHYNHLVERGFIPLKDKADLTNGFMDREVDWIPGFMKGMRLKDFPSFIRTTDGDDIVLNFMIREMNRASMASAILFNTFDDLESPALNALQKFLPPVYAVGPFSILSQHMIPAGSPISAINTSLWKQDTSCLRWLDGRKPGSVVYVSLGSIAVMSNEQLVEFAWGLASCGYEFIWVIRPDQARGESGILLQEFVAETKGRGMMVGWCMQKKVLAHPAIGVFLTHCGWNSMTESLCGGVPIICWPFFSEQITNCRYACGEWGIGMELGGDVNVGSYHGRKSSVLTVKREVVERIIKEMMDGEKGREMRKKAAMWKQSAAKAGGPHGSSVLNFNKVVNHHILQKEKF